MSGPRLDAELIGVDAFHAEKAAWGALADGAIEPNPFYEPGFLLASARHLEQPEAISLLVVRKAGRPVGLFPLARPRLRDGILFGAWSLYKNAYSSLTTPLLHADCGAAAFETALAFLAGLKSEPKVLYGAQIVENRPFATLLRAYCGSAGLPAVTTRRYGRAAIETDLSFEAYQRLQSGTTRKNLDRKMRRLESMGSLAFTTVIGDTPAGMSALMEFLALEASGWKGRRGTALANHPETRAFAAAVLNDGSNPRYFFERMSLDNKAIAMNLNLVAQGAAYTIKTAYDETYAMLSPGALLDRRTALLATAGGFLTRADSCADPGHRIETVWREREPIVSMLIGVSPKVTAVRLSLIETRMRVMSAAIDGVKTLRARLVQNA